MTVCQTTVSLPVRASVNPGTAKPSSFLLSPEEEHLVLLQTSMHEQQLLNVSPVLANIL